MPAVAEEGQDKDTAPLSVNSNFFSRQNRFQVQQEKLKEPNSAAVVVKIMFSSGCCCTSTWAVGECRVSKGLVVQSAREREEWESGSGPAAPLEVSMGRLGTIRVTVAAEGLTQANIEAAGESRGESRALNVMFRKKNVIRNTKVADGGLPDQLPVFSVQ
ncbi:hypothetical protein TURU_005816 [Turdus rufiventris]|nr:hypothetical protein TURU_005816 [Turdus rufiventris]